MWSCLWCFLQLRVHSLVLGSGLLLAAAGCSKAGEAGEPPGAASPDGGPAVAADPGQEIGAFDILLEAARPQQPAQTAFSGGLRSGPFPSRTLWRKGTPSGGCVLAQPEQPFCDPPCAPLVCVDHGKCLAEPTPRDGGAVRLRGLRAEGGAMDAPIETLAINQTYHLPVGLRLAYPPFAPGDPVEVSGSGGEVGPFSVAGKGVSPLEVLTPEPITVESGRPIELRWVPATAGETTTMQIALDLSVHGGTKGKIECDVPDSGSLVIDAALVTRLHALGTAGFPSVALTRASVTRSPLGGGQVKLSILSEVVRALAIPGQVSCEKDEDCPTGQTCQGNLLCGKP